ncbi:P-selectin-like [Morone saxatilis]|uniref:P-selectin-like n=1 Tax=Morone saxatilis TaxID=34816 RepID=UPI0015E1D18D|nr:P-selectin-like [Morone saxatilis]
MKWTLILLLGSTLAEMTLGWTYHYSNNSMNWTKARKFCQDKYTEMVVIQSQEENNFLVSILPNKSSSPYYWIGITKNQKNETWTWVGNNSTWIGNQSWAENEPNNNVDTEFCVEIYLNEGKNRGKWNDEKCANKKYPVCYKAQCNTTSCSRGRCQETIQNTTCLCEPGFEGDRCQTAKRCDPINSTHGSMSCSDPNGSFSFGSRCTTTCDEGFVLNGTASTECNSMGMWSADIPSCLAVECPPLSRPDNGNLSCSGGNQTFNSTCQFKCNASFLMIGSPVVTCGVNRVWSGPRPYCASYKQALMAVVGCGAISAFCCICFCWMKRRKRKKLAQGRQPEEVTCPSSEAQG